MLQINVVEQYLLYAGLCNLDNKDVTVRSYLLNDTTDVLLLRPHKYKANWAEFGQGQGCQTRPWVIVRTWCCSTAPA